jgi:hypothetical protein
MDDDQMNTTRPVRLRRRGAAALLLAPALAACAPGALGGGGQSGSSGPAGEADAPGTIRVQPVVPNTDLAVGRNRLALGVLAIPRGTTTPAPVPDAKLSLRFYFPIEPQPVPRGDPVQPEFRYVDDKQKGLYVTQVQFDQPGDWGVEVTGSAGGQPLTTSRARFTVKPKADTPAIGAPAPRSHNLTRYDVDDIRKIDSGATPNDMHELSIADAIDQGKPLVVIFSSPGFCVTQTCAPQLGEVQKLEAKFGPQVNFVHVEIFKDPMSRTPYETVNEWGLQSEPWTFFVDRQGLVAEKFEGPAPYAELEPALQKLV